MTVVDSVSKRAHFIPMHTTVTAEGAARLFLHQVWKLHGLLKCVVSDHGPQFIARFTRELYHLLGIKLVSSTASIPTRHQTTSSHGLRTLTKPFRSGDSQRVHGEDENGERRSEVHNPQGTRRHEKVLQLTQNSGSSIQPWQQSLPQCIGYPDHASFTETLTSTAWPLCSGVQDWTYGLPPKAATQDKATPSSV